jgi:hypothetical protein
VGVEHSVAGNSKESTRESHYFIKQVVTLWGNPDTGNSVPATQFDPGERQYPFHFEVPHDALPSFNRFTSGIFYSIEAYLDIPMSIDISVKENLQVDGGVITPQMRQTFDAMRSTESSKTVCCLCFAGGDIHSKLECPDTVLYSNQPRRITGSIKTDNFSSRNCNKATIAIVKHVKFTAGVR